MKPQQPHPRPPTHLGNKHLVIAAWVLALIAMTLLGILVLRR